LGRFRQQAKDSLDYLPDSWITIDDPNGQMLLNTARWSDATLPNRPLWESERRALTSGKPVVSNIIGFLILHRVGAFVAIPIFRDGNPLYLLNIVLNPDHFLATLREQGYPADWVAAIVDGAGHFVARIPGYNLILLGPFAIGAGYALFCWASRVLLSQSGSSQRRQRMSSDIRI
jgi:hypothetical protein